MPCDRFPEDLLLEHVLDDISPDQKQRVEEHLRMCAACRKQVAVLQQVRHVESVSNGPAGTLDGLLPLLQRQARMPVPTWHLLRQHPSLAAAAMALLALFFSAGYVQGNLVGRRGLETARPQVEAVRTLPEPPELGLLTLQTASVDRSPAWAAGLPESMRVAPAVDSL